MKCVFKILLLTCICLFGVVQPIIAQNTKKTECINIIKRYYKALNDYSIYESFDENNIAILFYRPTEPNSNIVQIDLRLFQGLQIPKETSLVDYLYAIKALRNDKKPPRFEYSIKEDTYLEKKITNKSNAVEIHSTVTVDKWISSGGKNIHIVDEFTLVNGRIAKVKSAEYTPPPKKEAPKWVKDFFSPRDDNILITLGLSMPNFSTSYLFSSYLDSYFSIGFGFEACLISLFKDKYPLSFTAQMDASFNMENLGFGVWTGPGVYFFSKMTENIDGVSVVVRDESKGFYLQMCPYIDIFIDPITLFVGYNFHLFNGAELNGFRLGMGFLLN